MKIEMSDGRVMELEDFLGIDFSSIAELRRDHLRSTHQRPNMLVVPPTGLKVMGMDVYISPDVSAPEVRDDREYKRTWKAPGNMQNLKRSDLGS